MAFYEIHPAVPSNGGEITWDESATPRKAVSVHLELAHPVQHELVTGYFGDVFAVSEALAGVLAASGLTGFQLVPATTSVSEDVEYPEEIGTPALIGLVITGAGLLDDLGYVDRSGRLVVSERAKDLLRNRVPGLDSSPLTADGRLDVEKMREWLEESIAANKTAKALSRPIFDEEPFKVEETAPDYERKYWRHRRKVVLQTPIDTYVRTLHHNGSMQHAEIVVAIDGDGIAVYQVLVDSFIEELIQARRAIKEVVAGLGQPEGAHTFDNTTWERISDDKHGPSS